MLTLWNYISHILSIFRGVSQSLTADIEIES